MEYTQGWAELTPTGLHIELPRPIPEVDVTNVDSVITAITEADTDDQALALLVRIPRATLEAVADQLYVDIWGKGLHTIRLACIAEARA